MDSPTTFLIASGVIAAVATPLALGLVPPNRIYGFRTDLTRANPSIWFRVNRIAGLSILAAAAVSALLLVFPPSPFQPVYYFAVPFVLAAVASASYLRRVT